MGREIFNILPWHRRKSALLGEEDGVRVDVGSLLVEVSSALPPHLYPQWRVEKRIQGPGNMPHVSLRNVEDRHTTKLLSLSALIDAGRYELREWASQPMIGQAAE